MTETNAFAAAAIVDNAPFDVVVAGAGPIGLSAALALADAMGPAARVCLLERVDGVAAPVVSPHSNADARAVALGAASVRMLDRLGVWSQCAGDSQPVCGIDITDSSLKAGVRPVLLSYDTLLENGEAGTHIVPSRALDAALRTTVAACRAITVVRHGEPLAFTPSAHAIEVRCGTGMAIVARLLVAADGRRSALRSLAGIQTTGWSYRQSALTATVALELPHGGRAVQHFLPGGPFALLPLPGHRACITWSEEAAEARRLMTLEPSAFCAELALRLGGRWGEVTLESGPQSWPLELFVARTFVAPRFALAGDAAHGVHPIAGQGMNLGLRDVAALADCVGEAHGVGLDIGSQAVLSRYERWRRFDTVSAAATFDALNRMFSSEGTLRRSLREIGLGLVDRLPGLKQRLVAEAAGVTGELPRLLRARAASPH